MSNDTCFLIVDMEFLVSICYRPSLAIYSTMKSSLLGSECWFWPKRLCHSTSVSQLSNNRSIFSTRLQLCRSFRSCFDSRNQEWVKLYPNSLDGLASESNNWNTSMPMEQSSWRNLWQSMEVSSRMPKKNFLLNSKTSSRNQYNSLTSQVWPKTMANN